jgi:hypothetical protein
LTEQILQKIYKLFDWRVEAWMLAVRKGREIE